MVDRRCCSRSTVSIYRRVVLSRKRGVVKIQLAMVATDASVLPGAVRDARPVVFTTPPKDKKLYRRITLQNGLLAILISDPEMANQTGGGSELESEADMSEEEGGSEDESDEVQISLPPSCLIQGWLTELAVHLGNVWQDMQSEEDGSAAPSAPVKKAAAAMAVGVGSFKDPDQLQVWDCRTGL